MIPNKSVAETDPSRAIILAFGRGLASSEMTWCRAQSSKLRAPTPALRGPDFKADARDRHQEIFEVLRRLCPANSR